MDGVDITIGLLLAYSAWRGYSRGLLSTLASVVAPVAGFVVATSWGNEVSLLLTQYIDAPAGFLRFVAYPLTFLIVAGGLRLGAAVVAVALGLRGSLLLNLMGGVASVAATAMVLGTAVMLLSSFAPPTDHSAKSQGIIAALDKRLKESMLAPPLANMAESVIGAVYATQGAEGAKSDVQVQAPLKTGGASRARA